MSAEAVGWVFRHSPYSGDALVIHLALADVANDLHGNEVWLMRAAIAEKSRCSISTVARTLRVMCDDGYLTVLEEGRGRGNPTRYRFVKVSQADTLSREKTGQADTLSGAGKTCHVSAEKVSSTSEKVSSATTAPLVNPKNPIRENDRDRFEISPLFAPASLRPADDPPPDPADLRRHVAETRACIARHPAGPPAPDPDAPELPSDDNRELYR
jgi:hypothetical protein